MKEHFAEIREFITFSLTTRIGQLRTEFNQDINRLDERCINAPVCRSYVLYDSHQPRATRLSVLAMRAWTWPRPVPANPTCALRLRFLVLESVWIT